MSFSAVHKPLDDIQNCMKWSEACILSKQASLLFYLMLVGWFIVGTRASQASKAQLYPLPNQFILQRIIIE